MMRGALASRCIKITPERTIGRHGRRRALLIRSCDAHHGIEASFVQCSKQYPIHCILRSTAVQRRCASLPRPMSILIRHVSRPLAIQAFIVD